MDPVRGCMEAVGKNFLVGVSIGGAIAIAAAPLAKAALWCGKKVSEMADSEEKSQWKRAALKVLSCAFKTIAVLAAAVASVGIGMATTVFSASFFGMAGSAVAGPYGLMIGTFTGAIMGAIIGGGIVGAFLTNLCSKETYIPRHVDIDILRTDIIGHS